VSTRGVTKTGRWSLRTPFALFALALVCAAGLAACGGGGTSSASGTPSTTAPSGSASLTAYVQCLESHGVPSSVASTFGQRRRGQGPGAGSTDTSPPLSPPQSFTRPTIPSQYQGALQACRNLRPAFGGVNSAAFAAYRNCLQLHGVTVPTPTTGPGGTGGAGGFGAALGQVQNDPNFKAAQQACAALAPTRAGATTATTVPAS
jgi:hypothetical protein